MGSFNVICSRIPLGGRGPSLRTVRGTISRSIAVICVRHDEKCRLHPDLLISRVNRVIGITGGGGPGIVVVISGYCNRFIRAGRPARIKTSLVTNSLVGGTNNNVTHANKCVTNETSLIRGYTCELAAPKLNARINTALNVGHRLCVNLFCTPRAIKRTLGDTICVSTLFSALNFGAAPTFSTRENSVIRSLKLRGRRELITFYRNIRDKDPVSDRLAPRP